MNTPKIIIPIQPKSVADAKKKIAAADKAGADLIEVWLDRIKNLDKKKIKDLLSLTKTPLMVNLKDKAEKGTYKGSVDERIELLAEAAKAGAKYIDLPLDLCPGAVKDLRKQSKKGELILSWHDFEKTPDLKDLKKLVMKAVRAKADVIKIATTAKKWTDLKPVFQLAWNLSEKKKDFIVMAMGSRGEPTRIITPLIGGLGMFAALNKKTATAPGQLTVAELKKWWEAFGK